MSFGFIISFTLSCKKFEEIHKHAILQLVNLKL